MKTLILLAALFAAGWLMYAKLQQTKVQEKVQKNAVQYTESLRQDVQKAKEAAETANQKIQKNMAEYNKGLQQAEGK